MTENRTLRRVGLVLCIVWLFFRSVPALLGCRHRVQAAARRLAGVHLRPVGRFSADPAGLP